MPEIGAEFGAAAMPPMVVPNAAHPATVTREDRVAVEGIAAEAAVTKAAARAAVMAAAINQDRQSDSGLEIDRTGLSSFCPV